MSRHSSERSSRTSLVRDLLASVVVFLVALPLCLGISIASGVPAAAGLITGIIGGLVVATIAGAPLQVSGPAAGLVVLTYDLVQKHGVESLGIVVLLCGVIQVVAGICRLGQWFRAVSPTVIYAMLTGIGILIVAGQVHVLVDDRPRENGIQNIRTIPAAIAKGLPWPKPASRESNSELLSFIQRFGALHEAQVEIQTAVDSHVSEQGTTAEHQQQMEGLTSLIRRQQELVAKWQLTVSDFEQSSAPMENRAEVLRDCAAAQSRLSQAERDLHWLRGDDVRHSQKEAVAAIQQVQSHLKSHDWAAKIGLMSILVIVIWNSLPARISQLIPSSLLAVILATLTCAVWSIPVLYVEIPERLADSIVWPTLTTLRDTPVYELLKMALMMAIIASAETLLCATAVDRMHSGPRTRYDRELVAQGIGNSLCGVFGALPMTGVIVRSAANVHAGATSRWSAFLHGGWLLICVVFMGGILRMIPTACLAGILVYTGYKLIGWRTLWRMWKEDRSEAFIFVVTVGLIVCEDLLIGVAAGIVMSAIKLLVIFSNLHVELRTDQQRKPLLELTGAATFLRLPVLAGKLDEVPREPNLRVDLTRLSYIDEACSDLLVQWAEQRQSSGMSVAIDWGKFHAPVESNGKH